jgi:signal transduction histidine kinase
MLLLTSAAGPDFLRTEPVAADSLIVDALERWGHAPRRWRLGTVAEATVLGDPDRLALALDALIENAIAHTTAEDRIEVSARREDGGVVLAVADSGCGIEPADLERIFHRFARAAVQRGHDGGGFGLDLAIVQAIAEAHHGSVRATSTPGHGAVFEILVPFKPARASGTGPESRPPEVGTSWPPAAH